MTRLACVVMAMAMLAACGDARSGEPARPPVPTGTQTSPAGSVAAAKPDFHLVGPADAKAVAAAIDVAGHGMTDVAATPAQSFRIMDGSRHAATLVSGLGRTQDATYPGCFAALVQDGRTSLVSTIGSGEWEAETCDKPTAVGILSAGETVAIGMLFDASSPNASVVEPVVLRWNPATGSLSIDQELSRAASLAGAVTMGAMRRSTAAATAAAPPATETAATKTAALPADVRTFVTRRDQCDHLRGEDSATADAVDRLERACRGTDADLARLRRDHAGDVAVMRALAAYDPQVE